MALFGKFTNAYLLINSVDLSSRVKAVTLNYNAAMLDASAMSNATKINLAGVLEWSVTAEFEQDYAVSGAGSVDATLFPLIGAAAFALSMRPDAGVQSTTNPTFAGNVVLANYNPASGTYGAIQMASATFHSAGTLSRTAS
jgi:hypothetical protein